MVRKLMNSKLSKILRNVVIMLHFEKKIAQNQHFRIFFEKYISRHPQRKFAFKYENLVQHSILVC